MRIGHGYDIHAFEGSGELWLGGVSIPDARGVRAHSDGDVILHALIDALLGAAALGDIGQHFSDTDPRWLGVQSSKMLEQTLSEVQAAGWKVGNVDVTVITEEPKLNPHREAIRKNVAQLLSVEMGCVNFKATTNEGLGAVGQAEGIAAHVVVLLEDA